jgi:phenylpropionate dioxygenase-like ring-hydroxylating dioxygenase large terminal subunit
MFLRNHWYVAAQPAEVGREPLGRRLCGDAVVLYRRGDGRVVALQDQCPHRKYALSKGRIEGDEIRCLYHGLKFDGSGACTFIPGQDRIPPALRARVYPAAEKHGWVWLWMGEPDEADEADIPDFGLNAHPDWRAVYGYLKIESDYRLILDNFLDLTHVGYVHVGTIGNAPVSAAPMDVSPADDRVRFTRLIPDVPPPPTFVKAVGFDGNVDRSQNALYLPPANFLNDIRAVPAGTDDDARGLRFVVNNTLTPETGRTTHYFWAVTRNFRVDDPATGEVLRAENTAAFEEDRAVIEEQQRMIDAESPPTPVVAIRADAAALAMRRVLEKLEADELSRAEERARTRR